MITIGKRKLVVNAFQPVELRPRYSLEVLNASPSLLASLDAGFVVPFRNQEIPESSTPAVVAIPVLKDAKEVYKEVKINTGVDKDGNVNKTVETLSEKDKNIMNEKLNALGKEIPKKETKKNKNPPVKPPEKKIVIEGFEEAKRKADALSKKRSSSKKGNL